MPLTSNSTLIIPSEVSKDRAPDPLKLRTVMLATNYWIRIKEIMFQAGVPIEQSILKCHLEA